MNKLERARLLFAAILCTDLFEDKRGEPLGGILDPQILIGGIIAIVIAVVVTAQVLIPQVQTALTQSSAVKTAWNFTGFQGAQALLGLVPFVTIAAILLGVVITFVHFR